MESYDWNTLYLSSPDLYRSFISVVKRFYEISFPMVTFSHSRMRDKPWVTEGLKKKHKNNHKFYKLYIRSGDEQTKSKYNRYKNMLRVCIREAENKYYQNLFEDTRSSSYNLWKNIGPIINPSKKKVE